MVLSYARIVPSSGVAELGLTTLVPAPQRPAVKYIVIICALPLSPFLRRRCRAVSAFLLLLAAINSTVADAQINYEPEQTYASMMRQRARRDSLLNRLRGDVQFTEDHLRTAFRDELARALVAGARQGRAKQDAALITYDTDALEHVHRGVKATAIGRERLVEGTETAARIRWHRDKGLVIDGEGLRSSTGVLAGTGAEMDMWHGERSSLVRGNVSVPYYPGREELWLGGRTFGFDDNSAVLLHPFGEKAEAYYTYASGDSAQIIMVDGRVIRMRELRIAPRKAHWTLIVGSFWFDESTYRLVRAAYRPSELVNIWDYNRWADGGFDDNAREFLALGVIANPAQATISAITIEYGLYEGRFWLPRRQIATGEIRVNIVRFPVEIVQKYEYRSVNGSDPLPEIPAGNSRVYRDSVWVLDSLSYHGDTLARRLAVDVRARANAERGQSNAAAAAAERAVQLARRLPMAGLPDSTVRRLMVEQMISQRAKPGCVSDNDTTSQVVRNRRTGLDVLVRVPCNDSLLINSPRLPAANSMTSADALSSMEMRDLLAKLDLDLQAGWGFRLPRFRTGLGDSLLRYNRVEGLSPAFGVKQIIGRGFVADGLARIGTADGVFEGEFGLARSNARHTVSLTAYRRLNTSNDWGDPFRLGASLQALVFGLDEGFYYRARGVSLGVGTAGNPSVQMKVFSERHLTARTRANFSLGNSLGGASFGDNIVAEPGSVLGASLEFNHSVGKDPNGFRMLTRARVENGMGDFAYARGLVDATLSRGLLGVASASLTLSAGTSMGDMPSQRLFLLGGTHTIRGQRAGTAAGEAYWMGRLELGTAATIAKPVVFADFGWAGAREDWSTPGRPLSGVGVGASLLDGIIRFDVARGIYPGTRIRFGMYLDAKF